MGRTPKGLSLSWMRYVSGRRRRRDRVARPRSLSTNGPHQQPNLTYRINTAANYISSPNQTKYHFHSMNYVIVIDANLLAC